MNGAVEKSMEVEIFSALNRKECEIRWKFAGDRSELVDNYFKIENNSVALKPLRMPLSSNLSFVARLSSEKIPIYDNYEEIFEELRVIEMIAERDPSYNTEEALLYTANFVEFLFYNETPNKKSQEIVCKITACQRSKDENTPEINLFEIKRGVHTIPFGEDAYKIKSPPFQIKSKATSDEGKEFEIIVRIEESKVQHVSELENDKGGVMKYVMEMYNDDEFKDITISIGDDTVKAHKCILVTNSKVFRAMLLHDTKEKREGAIKIEDTSVEAFKAFLKYLYTRELDDFKEMAVDLLILAEKYDVPCLKDTCDYYLSSSMTPEDGINNLVKAHLCNAQALKKAALKAIRQNFSEIQKSEVFSQFCDAYPLLLKDLIQNMEL